jgi:2-dehydropantoate 2-reductase
MFIAYQAPLPGEEGLEAPGVAFWLPPASPCPFAGSPADVEALLTVLRAGGLAASHDPSGPGRAAMLSAILMPNLVALEAEGWSLTRFVASPSRRLAARAAAEALDIVHADTGRRAGAGLRWLGLRGLGSGLRLGQRIMPLPLEPYLAYHFTKVGDQTREMIQAYIGRGSAADLPVAALRELCELPGFDTRGSS